VPQPGEHHLLCQCQLPFAIPKIGDPFDHLVWAVPSVFTLGEEGVLVQAINVEEATGLLSLRYAPERHQEFRSVIKNSGWNECLAPYAAAPLALCDPVDAGALEGYQQSKYVYGKTISGNT
jgi:hypothetical protein